MRRHVIGLLALGLACGPAPKAADPLGASYVRLALALGVHDSDYIDAFYGPASAKHKVQRTKDIS